MFDHPFAPHFGSNQVITPAASSAAVNINADDKQVLVINTGANIGYFRTFSLLEAADKAAAGVATTADVPLPAGQSRIITKGVGHNRMATISAAGTTFQVMTGEGK